MEVLDAENGNPVKAWKQLGSPEPPSRQQTATLKQKAWALKTSGLNADSKGYLTFKEKVSPWSIILLKEL